MPVPGSAGGGVVLVRDREGPPTADDLADATPLPEQEQVYRAPVRFGHVPVARTPLGWDPRRPGFRNHYPDVRLPTQIVDLFRLCVHCVERAAIWERA